MDNSSFFQKKKKFKIKYRINAKLPLIENRTTNNTPINSKSQNFDKKKTLNKIIFKTTNNSRKNSSIYIRTTSGSNSNSSKFRQININKSFLNNKKINFDISKLEIKAFNNLKIKTKIGNLLNKSKEINSKTTTNKEKFNQKLIFNNIGIHYHKNKNNNINKIEIGKKADNNDSVIYKMKKKINFLIEQNCLLEKDKTDKNKKIEDLKEKVNNLTNFINKKNSSENEIRLKYEDKINSLENLVNELKNENQKLKNEILSLKDKKLELKKDKVSSKNHQDNNLNFLSKNDIERMKLITIDPDKF